jgi:SAM-dependent methyltransferase
MTWEQAVLSLRERPDAKALIVACFYDDPLLDAAHRYAASTEWLAVRALIGESGGGSALDVGAGRGISAFALARDGWRVTALEPDDSTVVGAAAIRRLATEAAVEIEVTQEWGEKLPFQDASFDLVHCRQVLHHARNLTALCAEIGRVLKPGGIFIATREHVISRQEDLPVFLAAHPLHSLYAGENAFLLQDYLTAIAAGGISLEHVLNPKESDINLYPETCDGVKRRWARRLRLPSPRLIPDALLRYAGARNNTPGRLYTFAGHR